ncbi:hypothetical protein [Streptomyces tendae]|uniref:hypothetical protein n=1 Tax=Streptomyces tendae TaxID=1932 RepID=UPI00379AD03E
MCGQAIVEGRRMRYAVPDSSAVSVHDLAHDGLRLVTACSQEHLDVLRQRYARRPFIEEELWIGKIARLLDKYPDGHRIDRLAEAAGLTVGQVEQALQWLNRRASQWCRQG